MSVPVKDGDTITMVFNSNTTSVSGVNANGVYEIYYAIMDSANDDFLVLSGSQNRTFKIQKLNWAGTNSPNDYVFVNDGLPLTTGDYISFETTVTSGIFSATEYLQSGSEFTGAFGSEFINIQQDSPTHGDGRAEFRVWNITTTQQTTVGYFVGTLNPQSNSSNTRTWNSSVGQNIYYNETYYIQNAGKAVGKNQLYYWNQQNNSGVGLNVAGPNTLPIIFLNSSSLIPPSTTPVLPARPTAPSQAPTDLDKIEHEILKWLLIGIAVIIAIIIGIILIIVVIASAVKIAGV